MVSAVTIKAVVVVVVVVVGVMAPSVSHTPRCVRYRALRRERQPTDLHTIEIGACRGCIPKHVVQATAIEAPPQLLHQAPFRRDTLLPNSVALLSATAPYPAAA